MANIFNKFLNSLKLEDEEDEVDEFEPDEEFDLDYEEKPARQPKSKTSDPSYDEAGSEFDVDSLGLDEEEEYQPPKRVFSTKKREAANVVPIRRGGMEVYMVRPNSMDSAEEICDLLLSGKAIVINMEGLNFDLAQRIMDMVSGSCYTLRGKIRSISKSIFMVGPKNIEMSGEFKEVGGSVKETRYSRG